MFKLATTGAWVLILAVSAGSAGALELPGPLVQTGWLAANLKSRQLVILDVRTDPQNFNNQPPPNTKPDPKAPLTGHIPGARLWDFKLVRENRVIDNVLIDKMVPAKRNFEALMRELGVRNDSAVVVVVNANDSVNVTMGTRAYWTLKYFGHDRTALLDGGTGKWVAEKRPVSYVTTKFAKSAYAVAGERRELLATSAEVEAALLDKSAQLVDGRTADFYVGQSITNDARARGHIPEAKMLSHVELMDEKSRIFKPLDELRKLAETYSIDPAKPAITYSDTGLRGSGAWFALSELLGNTDVRLYDGSMHEWTRSPARLVSTRWEMN